LGREGQKETGVILEKALYVFHRDSMAYVKRKGKRRNKPGGKFPLLPLIQNAG
jgi:hypothetical protein